MITFFAYVVCVLGADILAARWIVSLPLNLFAPAGVFVIAPTFSLRDAIHERFGRRGAYFAIAIASLLSWCLAFVTGNGLLSRVTLSSVVAFVINEFLDTEIYAAIRRRSRLQAILVSNGVSSLIDSVLFIWIAFGWVVNLMLGQYLVKLILSAMVGIWIVRRSDSTLE